MTAAQHLIDMDIEGIDVQVLFPTGLLNFGSKREAEVAVAMARAYNDWLHEFCQTDPRRFKGVALVGLQDMPEAVREMTRAVTQLGMVAVFVPSYVYPGKDLGSHDFDELYAEAERLGVPIGVHRVAGTGTIGFDRFTRFPVMHALVPMFEEAAAVANMVFGGVFERYPRLNVAFLEAGGALAALAGGEAGRARRHVRLAAPAPEGAAERVPEQWAGVLLVRAGRGGRGRGGGAAGRAVAGLLVRLPALRFALPQQRAPGARAHRPLGCAEAAHPDRQPGALLRPARRPPGLIGAAPMGARAGPAARAVPANRRGAYRRRTP